MEENRKLNTILFADIAGFTALMQTNESKALGYLDHFKSTLESTVPAYQGIIVQFFGDAVLLTFDSAVQGVKCAMTLQSVFIDEGIPIRIGMHLGDVVFTETNVFGDGVNIASRIESMGVPGCIMLSRTVRNQIRNQADISLISLGEFEFKNVEEPLEVFAISNLKYVVPDKVSLVGKFKSKVEIKRKLSPFFLIGGIVMTAFLAWFGFNKFFKLDPITSSIPRLAVLDFDNKGMDVDEFITKGILDELNSRLVGLQQIEVISRSSIESIQELNLSPQEVGKELAVDYILEGKVDWHRNPDGVQTLTFNPSLVKVDDNSVKWTGQFTKNYHDASEIHFDLSVKLIEELNVSLSNDERKSMEESLTDNHLAYEAYLKGRNVLPPGHGEEKDFRSALRFFKQAVLLDPDFGRAWLELGNVHMDLYWYGYDSHISLMDTALVRINKAKSLLPDGDPWLEMELGDYNYRLREMDQALFHFSNALKERPNDSRILQYIAEVWRRQGLFDDAIDYMEKGLSLDPLNHNIITELSWTYLFIGNYDRSLELQEMARKIAPDALWNHLMGTLIHWSRGQENDLEEAKKLLSNVPNPRSDYPAYFWINQLWFEGDVDGVERLVDNLNVEAIGLQHIWEPKSLINGLVARYRGNRNEANWYFNEALEILKVKVDESPEDFRLHVSLGLAYAGLGERDMAIDSGVEALNILPLEEDHLLGLDVRYGMMRIFAILGEDDKAMDMMSQLLSVPCQIGGYFFTKNPEFSRFRRTTRFQDLLDKQQKIFDTYNKS